MVKTPTGESGHSVVSWNPTLPINRGLTKLDESFAVITSELNIL